MTLMYCNYAKLFQNTIFHGESQTLLPRFFLRGEVSAYRLTVINVYYVLGDSQERSTPIEGKHEASSTLEGRNVSQVIAMAITFSCVYSKCHKAKGSLVPAIQVSNSLLALFFFTTVSWMCWLGKFSLGHQGPWLFYGPH